MGSCLLRASGIVVYPSRVTNKAYLCIGQHVSAAVTVILADVLVTVFNWLRGNEPVHEATPVTLTSVGMFKHKIQLSLLPDFVLTQHSH